MIQEVLPTPASMSSPMPSLSGLINLKWSKYIPMLDREGKPRQPSPKQIAFLALPHEEVLYGGAAGGGKSDALLMGALQYADDPSYKGILFRRSLTDHELPGSLMDRAKTWLAPFFETKECWWGRNNTVHFRRGGQLTFGYLDKEGSRGKERYQSANFHFIGFDELTHFTEDEYNYLFTRMRRDRGDMHIPLRMRAATNPGGRGHSWVKKRFSIKKDAHGNWFGANPSVPFIQAFVEDNPALDAISYRRQLDKQKPEIREQLAHGDWEVIEGVIHQRQWYRRRWYKKGEFYLLDYGGHIESIPESYIFKFGCIDSACSENDGYAGRSFKSGQEPSWHVCGLFGMTPKNDLLWLDNLRGQWPWPDFINRIIAFDRYHRPAFHRVEDNAIGAATLQQLHSRGVTAHPVRADRSKLVRNVYAQVDAQAGKIWLPCEQRTTSPWMPELDAELFTWTGKEGELADQIDVLSSASEYRSQRSHGVDESSEDTGSPRFTSEGREPTGSLEAVGRILGPLGASQRQRSRSPLPGVIFSRPPRNRLFQPMGRR